MDPPPASAGQYRPITPKNAVTQQARVIRVNTVKILTSLQPHISKWWWIGAILKIILDERGMLDLPFLILTVLLVAVVLRRKTPKK